MGSVFERMLKVSDRTQDKHNGEAFSFTPMRKTPNIRPVPDSARIAIETLTATFDNAGRILEIGGPAGAERISSGPMISVLALYLPQGVTNGDRFTRVDDGKVYEVTFVDPDGFGRLFISLVER